MKTTRLNVEGMSCEHCVGHVTEALLSVFGVKDARVDLKGKSAEVDHDDMVTLDALIAAIGDEGYEASIGG